MSNKLMLNWVSVLIRPFEKAEDKSGAEETLMKLKNEFGAKRSDALLAADRSLRRCKFS